MTLEKKLIDIATSMPYPAGKGIAEIRFHEMFNEHPDQVDQVPFIVLAMNKDEAQEMLQDAPVFAAQNTAEQITRFEEMQRALYEAFPNPDDWLDRYGDEPEQWQPHIFKGEHKGAIAELLEGFAMKHCTKPKNARFWPDVKKSIPEIWSKSEEGQDDFWQGLPVYYVLVIDGISLFHPTIRQRLQNVKRETKHVAILLFSPIELQQCALDGCIEQELASDESMKWVFRKFAVSLDVLCEIGLNHNRHLSRWFLSGIPELLAPRPNPANAPWQESRDMQRLIHNGGAV